jgi:hypothetical protein
LIFTAKHCDDEELLNLYQNHAVSKDFVNKFLSSLSYITLPDMETSKFDFNKKYKLY